MRGLLISDLSWREVESALSAFDTVLLPVGAACKEHGPHLPLNTDFLMAEYLTWRVVDACRVIALPTVGYGHYPAFVEYPGSTHIRFDAFRDTIIDICRSFLRHGVRKFYVLNTGISTIEPLSAARQVLAAERAHMEFSDLRSLGKSARVTVQTQPRGTHADEIETSNILCIAPHVVRMDLARPELAPDRPGGLTRQPDSAGGVYSSTGSWGDPTCATAEKGRVVTEAIVAEIIAFLQSEFGV